MPSSAPSPPSAQPPPELPSIPGLAPVFADYLRRFSLWCRNGFADKLSISTSIPYVHMLSPAGNTSKISVNDSGILLSTPVAQGGQEGTPTIAFMPVVTGNQAGHPTGASGSITSASYQMFGLGAGTTFTPQGEHAAVAHATGLLAGSVAGSVIDLVIVRGTGTAPAHGAALTGTILGGPTSVVIPVAGTPVSGTIVQVASGLAISTAYWFDIGVRASAGTATITQLNFLVDGIA